MRLSEPSQWDIQPNGVNITARHRITGHTFSGTRDAFNTYLETYKIANNWNENILAIGTTVESPTAPTNGTWLECDGGIYDTANYSELSTILPPLNRIEELETLPQNVENCAYLRTPTSEILIYNQVDTNWAIQTVKVTRVLNDGTYLSYEPTTFTANKAQFRKMSLAQNDNTGRIVLAVRQSENNKSYYSDDDGITWTEVTLPSSGQLSLVTWDPSTDKFILTADDALTTYLSDDGITWTADSTVFPENYPGMYKVSFVNFKHKYSEYGYNDILVPLNIASASVASIPMKNLPVTGHNIEAYEGSYDGNTWTDQSFHSGSTYAWDATKTVVSCDGVQLASLASDGLFGNIYRPALIYVVNDYNYTARVCFDAEDNIPGGVLSYLHYYNNKLTALMNDYHKWWIVDLDPTTNRSDVYSLDSSIVGVGELLLKPLGYSNFFHQDYRPLMLLAKVTEPGYLYTCYICRLVEDTTRFSVPIIKRKSWIKASH